MKFNSKDKELKIFLWSPMLSNVGTNTAMMGMANAIKKYSKSNIYLLDILGEFSNFNIGDNFHLKFSKINHIIPNTGKISKIFIFLFSIFSIPFLIKQISKKKPDIIITGLVGFIPSLMKYFFPKLIVINSIQGYPKFNFIRKIIWRFFYKKSDCLITMTNKTKEEISNVIGINKDKIYIIENPVISRKIRILSSEDINEDEKFIFKKKVFCAIGRLTYQKNFDELLKFINKLNSLNRFDFNLVIIGAGEKKRELENYIIKNKLKNCFLLGFKRNPYKYLVRSDLYISTSLWEEPGHTLLEAAYLNVPILSSNCPNGPEEIIKNGHNGYKYQIGKFDDFLDKIILFEKLNKIQKKTNLLNMKKISMNYTEFRFNKKFFRNLIYNLETNSF